MNITVIGCGNAFSEKQFNQSFLLEEEGETLLIDCGSQTPSALARLGVRAANIDKVYISHLHADHIGGLEWLAFMRYDWTNKPRTYDDWKSRGESYKPYAPTLIGNTQLLDDLWSKSLRGGLESMEGFVARLETFFEPFRIEPNTSFIWKGWEVNLVQQIHILSGSTITPSFGIMFKKTGHKTVYFVTDSQHCSPRQMEEFYKEADLIFQDCECTGVNFQFPEGEKVYKTDEGVYRLWPKADPHPYSAQDADDDDDGVLDAMSLMAQGVHIELWKAFKFGSGVHANYAQLAGYDSANSIKLSPEIKAKMYLSHYQDFVSVGKDMYGNPIDWVGQAEKDGFAGFVKVGQVFEV